MMFSPFFNSNCMQIFQYRCRTGAWFGGRWRRRVPLPTPGLQFDRYAVGEKLFKGEMMPCLGAYQWVFFSCNFHAIVVILDSFFCGLKKIVEDSIFVIPHFSFLVLANFLLEAEKMKMCIKSILLSQLINTVTHFSEIKFID